MTWVTWRQYRYQGALAAGLFAALAVVLLITGLHVAQMWHSELAGCMQHNSCGSLSLNSPILTTLVVGTSAVPLLPGLFWGAPMVAHELETGTNQFAWTQSITRRRWLAVRPDGCCSPPLSSPERSRPWSPGGPARTTRCTPTPSRPTSSTSPTSCRSATRSSRWPRHLRRVLLRRTLPALAVTLAGFVGSGR